MIVTLWTRHSTLNASSTISRPYKQQAMDSTIDEPIHGCILGSPGLSFPMRTNHLLKLLNHFRIKIQQVTQLSNSSHKKVAKIAMVDDMSNQWVVKSLLSLREFLRISNILYKCLSAMRMYCDQNLLSNVQICYIHSTDSVMDIPYRYNLIPDVTHAL